jgi:hypothetical protein
MSVLTTIALYVDRGAQLLKGYDLAKEDPAKVRTLVDNYVVDQLNKNHPQEFRDSIPAMAIQEAMNAHPDVPNMPVSVSTGAPGVTVLTNQNFVTSSELARQMDANNEKLLAAMTRIVAAQNQPQPAKE